MAYEEYIKRAIQTNRRYEDLPDKVRAILPLQEWKAKVKELCIQQGLSWAGSMASSVCNENDYYEDLVKTYKAWARLYPYHLADYVARVLRITPFRFYLDVLFLMLKDEKSYDRIPNFTAADALRVVGVGRNEYIAIMNACKAKKLMWRVNKGIARDLLPSAPRDIRMESWWLVSVVNVGDAEFRELSPGEAGLLRAACDTSPPLVSLFDPGLLQGLYKRGMIYLDVPVAPDDRFTLPPLEGFVSNKTSESGDESVDPLEPLLYSLFLANSSRLDQVRLADILGVGLQQLHLATALAVRLGFASKVGAGSSLGDEAAAVASARSAGLVSPQASGSQQLLSIPDSDDDPAAAAAAAAGGTDAGGWAAGADDEGSEGGAIAVVVDAEATGYLMMGALSPGLKRHSVTLFEGGRVGGAGVMEELVAELAASAAAGEGFEGDMVLLVRHIQSLGVLLSVVRAAAASQGQQVELLRKESLAGLDPQSAAKVLCHAYTAILPIAPLPGPCLPLTPFDPGAPTFFGPTPEANSPWLSLALYAAARCGPVSLVFVAGQRVWRLPPQLEGVTHALLWGWRGGDGKGASDPQPLLVEGTSLLCSLNELLCRTAVMVQPLVRLQQLPSSTTADSHLVAFVDVPLPLCPAPAEESQQHVPAAAAAAAGKAEQGHAAPEDADVGERLLLASADGEGPAPELQQPHQQSQSQSQPPGGEAAAAAAATVVGGKGVPVMAVDRQRGGKLRQLTVPAAVVAALQQLQLADAVGWLRMVKLPPPAAAAAVGGHGPAGAGGWLPLSVSLGVPLFCPVLCEAVCSSLTRRQCLGPRGSAAWRAAQLALQQQLWQLVTQYGEAGGPCASFEAVAGAAAADARGSSSGAAGVAVPFPMLQQQQPQQQRGGGAASAAAGAGLEGLVVSGDAELPACNLLFDGASLLPFDVSSCLQGVRLW